MKAITSGSPPLDLLFISQAETALSTIPTASSWPAIWVLNRDSSEPTTSSTRGHASRVLKAEVMVL